MPAKVCSEAVSGIEAYPVEAEVKTGYGETRLIAAGFPQAVDAGGMLVWPLKPASLEPPGSGPRGQGNELN